MNVIEINERFKKLREESAYEIIKKVNYLDEIMVDLQTRQVTRNFAFVEGVDYQGSIACGWAFDLGMNSK